MKKARTRKTNNAQLAYYRIHSIALASILVGNAIKRVIQVVIVTLAVLRTFIFHPLPPPPVPPSSGVPRASSVRTRRVSLGASLAATRWNERRWSGGGGVAGSGWKRIGKATRGEWRPVRGWSLKVRGTGLIGLGCRRERKREKERAGV